MTPLERDPQSHKDVDEQELASREFLENAMSLWEEALSTEPPDFTQGQEGRRRSLSLEEAVTAPRVTSQEVAPSKVYTYDGFIPVKRQDLYRVLRQLASAQIRRPVEVRLDETALPTEPIQAARVFVFDEPVHEATDANGQLFRSMLEGTRVEWEAGEPATLLVEVISGSSRKNTEPEKTSLLCTVGPNQIAQWTSSD